MKLKKKVTAYFSKYPLGTSLSQIIYLASKIYKNKILSYFTLYNECTLNFAFTISISVILGIIFRYSATDHDQIKYIYFFHSPISQALGAELPTENPALDDSSKKWNWRFGTFKIILF